MTESQSSDEWESGIDPNEIGNLIIDLDASIERQKPNRKKESKMNPTEKKSQQELPDWNKNQGSKHKVIKDSNGISLGKGAPPHGNPPTGSTNPRSQSSQNSTNPTVQHSTKQNTTNILPGGASREKEPKKKYLNGEKKIKENPKENGPKSDILSEKKESKLTSQTANLANSNNSRRDGHKTNDTKEKQTAEVGTLTEPECLAPCDTGTEVHLSGIIWHESDSGMLVVNVTWRNRSYVGTLLDASRHDWAPPRLTDGESDSNQQSSRKPRPGRRDKGAKGGRTRNDGVNGQRGKVGKRVSPNDQENNSDGDGKPANKKPRPNCPRVPTPDGSDTTKGSKTLNGGGRDSPVPIGGYYVCEEEDCEKKFKNLEALQYHKPKCKKVPNSKNAECSENAKKAKLEPKAESKNETDSSNPVAANSTNTEGDEKVKEESKNNDSEAIDVAKTLIGMHHGQGDVSHDLNGPPSLNAPPALAKRPDNPKTPADKSKSVNHHPSNHQPTMPRLVKKPHGAESLPPMPSLQPKPGLMTHSSQPTTPVLTTGTGQSQPGVQPQTTPGTPLKTRITSPQTTPVVLPVDPALDSKLVGINTDGSAKRARSPTFQPVTETSVSPTPNPRASSPFSDISDAGDENPITDMEKDTENKKILKSSLAYKTNTSLSVNNQFNQSHPVHQRYNETSYSHGLNRDEKKEVKGDDKDAKIVKNEFKSEPNRLPPSSSHDQNRAKLHPSETKKDRPTATIPPMNSGSTDRNKNDSKTGPQKQHTPKKDQSPTGKTPLSAGVGIPMGIQLPVFAPGYPPPGYPPYAPPGFPGSQPSGGISGTFYPSNSPYPGIMIPPGSQSKGDYKRDGKPSSNQERGQAVSPAPQRTTTYPYSQAQAQTPFGHYHGASYGLHKK